MPELRYGVKRDLRRRHVNMIALAGLIGTGLFLASGQVLALSGPAGALLGYVVMGLVTCGVTLCTAELSSFMPVNGGFVRHAAAFVHPALGVATGVNFWYTLAITTPAELVAAQTLITFWTTGVNGAVWYSIFIPAVAAFNLCGVRWYGESEVVFACLKIFLITLLILVGIVIDFGGGPSGKAIGFRYWQNPGAFNTYLVKSEPDVGRFLAFWSTLIPASFGYGGIPIIALAAAETQSPRQTIPNAIKMTFMRVLVFYVLSIFVIGLLVPFDDPNLGIETGTAQQSPYVIAFDRAGISVLPSLTNAIICTSAFSSGSACIFYAARTLYGLAEEGIAPKVFLRVNRFGSPYVAVAFSLILTPLCYLSLDRNSSVVFGWFVHITTVASLISWVVIQISFLRFFYAMKRQSIDRNRLVYKSPMQPYLGWVTLTSVVLIILFSGISVLFPGHWSITDFLTYYVDIAIFLLLWACSWLVLRKRPLSVDQIDLSEIFALESEQRLANPKLKPRSFWRQHVF